MGQLDLSDPPGAPDGSEAAPAPVWQIGVCSPSNAITTAVSAVEADADCHEAREIAL
jgi:hypothetical protein